MSVTLLQLIVIVCCHLTTGPVPAGGSEDRIVTVLSAPCFGGTSSAAAAVQWSAKVRSLAECLWSSQQMLTNLQSIGLLQLDRDSSVCSLYRYRDVCQHLVNVTMEQQQHCDTVVDSGYNIVTANAHFAAVWVGGKGPALENLVCRDASGPRNPVWSSQEGVVWTSDGAQLDGAGARLWVNDSTGFNFTGGLTMAIEVKRQPGVQAFMELTDCATFSGIFGHFWEYLSAGKLWFNPGTKYRYYIETTAAVLTSDPSEFAKIVVTHDVAENLTKLYLNSAELVGLGFFADTGVSGFNCLKIGYRTSSFGLLKGTVKMAAIANGYLPVDVIRRFLAKN